MNKRFKNVEEYIATTPQPLRAKLRQLRVTVRKAAPKAEEFISYNMPAYKQEGMLLWFAAFKNHIGFYPKTEAMVAFKKELAAFKHAKGSVQFPNDQPLPLDLVRKIVRYRVKQNFVRSVVQGLKDVEKGRTVSLSEAKKRLGLT